MNLTGQAPVSACSDEVTAMKRTDGFDARRLRPRQQRSWGARLAAALGLLLIIVGVFLTGSGAASLFSNHEVVVSMALDREAAVTLLVTGLILLLLGMFIRRRVRRRLHEPSGLSISPGLKKKR
jgi:polyferredoxin